jgi:hypothetical protein
MVMTVPQAEIVRVLQDEERGGGEGFAWGLPEEQSPMTLIPDWMIPGTLVLAPVLERIASDYGRDVAFVVDSLSAPCERCARNTYRGGLCIECEEYVDARAGIEPAMVLERSGAFSPRCD